MRYSYKLFNCEFGREPYQMNYSRILFTTGLLACLSLAPASAQQPELKVKIGRDTTYIDGPITKDGYVDYIAHLNKVLSKDVTAENNAAVLLLKASPGEITSEKYMKRYCKALGIAPLPLKGDYYQDAFKYAWSEEERKRKRKLTDVEKNEIMESIREEYDKVMEGPWKRAEHPLFAKWLDDNEKYLDLIRKASLRKHYYHPMLGGDGEGDPGSVIAILLPQVQSSREYGRALTIRAMMYLGEGKIEKCTEDLLTMRRLGNHIATGSTIVEQLVGIAIIGMTQSVEQKMAFSGRLSADELLDYRSKMNKTRAKTNMVKSFGQCERFMYLDAVQQVMRGGATGLNEIVGMAGSGFDGGTAPKTQMRKLVDQVISNSTDWMITMQEGNRIYDKYENILKSDDWVVQDKGLEQMDKEIQEITKSVGGTAGMVKAMLGGPEYRGKMMGKVFVSLLLPALNAATTAERRAQVMDDLTYIVLSAAAHKAEMGDFPESIKNFRGRAGDNLPIDRYAEDDYHYQRKGEGFIVYSIGPNRKDDQGRGVYNEESRDGDDFGAGYDSVKAETPPFQSKIN